MKILVSSSVAVLGGLLMAGTTRTLVLSGDQTLDVPEGETVTLARLTCSGQTLVKTGGGTLRLEAVCGRLGKLDVRAGALETGVPAKPACLARPWFHVDATAPSSMTTETSDGRTFVSEWRDAAGGAVAARPAHARPRPYVLEKGQNGRPVMDFGSYSGGSMAPTGYGAMLKWSAVCERPAEIFIVAGDTEDSIRVVVEGKNEPLGRNAPLVGTDGEVCNDIAPLIRGNPPKGAKGDRHSPLLLGVAGFGQTYGRASFTVDGMPVADPTAYELPDGLHLVGIHGIDTTKLDANPTDTKTRGAYALNAFACERGRTYGGQRIGECIVLANALSEDDRTRVENYLLAKWSPICVGVLEFAEGAALRMPDGGQIVASVCRSAAPVAAQGGELVADTFFTGDSVVVRAGVHAEDPLRGEGSWFHVDASDAATCTADALGGTNFVSRWRDVNGGPVAAVARTFAAFPEWYRIMVAEGTTRLPWLDANAAGGRALMNFGSLASVTGSTDKVCSTKGWGGSLVWTADCATPRELFIVMKDSGDAKGVVIGGTSGIGARCQALVGNFRNGYPLVRGNPPPDAAGDRNSPLLLGMPAGFHGSAFRVDGMVVDPTSFCPSDDLHLVHVSDTPEENLGKETATLNAFAAERSYIFGGQLIGEFMLFTNALDAAARTRIAAALDVKWRGGTPREVVYGNVAIAAGSTLTQPWERVVVTGTLALDGVFAAPEVAATRIAVSSDDAQVEGTLDIGTAGGAVAFARPAALQDLLGKEVRLVAARAAKGHARGWTLTGAPNGCIGVVALKADGLYARFLPSGSIVIIR